MPKPAGRFARPLRLPATVVTTSEAATEAVGEALAPLLEPGDVVALTGPLGAGKTCFTRGLARGLGAREPVASPTFALIREYRGRLLVRHVDLYRLDPGDVKDLDWRDLFYGDAVAVVEWAEKAGDVLPVHRYLVDIQPDPEGDPGRRVLTISLAGAATATGTAGTTGLTRNAPATRGAVDAGREAGPAVTRTPGPTVTRAPAPTVTRAPAPAGTPSRVLGLDTSTRARSLALLAGGEIRELYWGPGQGDLLAEDLSGSLRELLAEAGLEPQDLELIAVALGPGSFTGVKVGLASAKALAYALRCPLKGVGTLDVLAAGALAPGRTDAVLAFVDARRGEVFGAAYLGGPDSRPVPVAGGDPYVTGPAAEVSDILVRVLLKVRPEGLKVALAGDGVELCAERVQASLAVRGGIVVPQAGRRDPRASDLVLLACERFRAEAGDDPFALQPLYLREPDVSPPGCNHGATPGAVNGPVSRQADSGGDGR